MNRGLFLLRIKNWHIYFPYTFYFMPNLGSLRGRVTKVQRLEIWPFPVFN